jgi:hypothetical protein
MQTESISHPLEDPATTVTRARYQTNIKRRTIDNIRAAGLRIDHVLDLDRVGMFKLIMARPGA